MVYFFFKLSYLLQKERFRERLTHFAPCIYFAHQLANAALHKGAVSQRGKIQHCERTYCSAAVFAQPFQSDFPTAANF